MPGVGRKNEEAVSSAFEICRGRKGAAQNTRRAALCRYPQKKKSTDPFSPSTQPSLFLVLARYSLKVRYLDGDIGRSADAGGTVQWRSTTREARDGYCAAAQAASARSVVVKASI